MTRGERLAPFRWKKGQSGNPNGRPKKRPLSDRYAKLLELTIPEDIRKKLKLQKNMTFGDAIALRSALQALVATNHAFAKEIREAIEGKAPQRVEIATPDDEEVIIRVVYDNENGNGRQKVKQHTSG